MKINLDFDFNRAKLLAAEYDIIAKPYQELISAVEYCESLDRDFARMLKDLARFDNDYDKLHDANKHKQLMNDLDDDSTVIYFRSAGLLRVYSPKDVCDKLQKRANTNYRKHKNQVFEVVGHDKPQKIIVIIDSRNEDELHKVKDYLIEFSKERQMPITDEDLLIFDNDLNNTYEIIINSWIVSNVEEKEAFICGLLRYIDIHETTRDLTQKMQKRNSSNLPNMELHNIPWVKKLLSNHVKDADIEGVEALISKHGNQPIFLTINYTNNNHINMQNVKNSSVTITNNNREDEDPFIRHLESADLDWYYPDSEVEYNTLYNEYIDNVDAISKHCFTKKYQDKLYIKGNRVRKNNSKKVQMVTIL